MNIEKIMNLQYRKVLTKKEEIKNYILASIKYKKELVELSDIEILSIFLIDLDNLNYPIINEENSQIIKEYVNNLLEKNYTQKKERETSLINQIYELSTKYRLNDELNKQIALGYANYLNDNVDTNLLFIGVNSLEELL